MPKILPHNLPQPDPVAQAHSEQMRNFLCAKIANQGPITFAEYMKDVLYAPMLGYYSAGSRKFGAEGDFITAPEISPLFAKCLAKQCAQVLTELGNGDILELGAGSGRLAVDLLSALAELGCLPQTYFILEVSADLRERQKALLQEKLPDLFTRVKWLDNLPSTKWQGIIFANEVMDALPVHKFNIANEISEYFVTCDEEKNLLWHLAQPSSKLLEQKIIELGITNDYYESEINLIMFNWLESLSAHLKRGLLLFVDYGFPRHEYYHPDRNMGTLMCHYRHRAHSDPLILPGLQDITAHVDFTTVAEAADQIDLDVAGYTNQASFLLSCGLMDTAQSFTSMAADEQWALSQQIKKLTLPSEMGELFKAIALTRDLTIPLQGFNLYDMRGKL